MPWPDFPAWLDGSKEASDAAKADRQRSARRPLGRGERLILLVGSAAAAVFLANIFLQAVL